MHEREDIKVNFTWARNRLFDRAAVIKDLKDFSSSDRMTHAQRSLSVRRARKLNQVRYSFDIIALTLSQPSSGLWLGAAASTVPDIGTS